LDIHLHGEEGYNMGVGVSTRGRSELFAEAEAGAEIEIAKRPAPVA
jgi:hypothetical protein